MKRLDNRHTALKRNLATTRLLFDDAITREAITPLRIKQCKSRLSTLDRVLEKWEKLLDRKPIAYRKTVDRDHQTLGYDIHTTYNLITYFPLRTEHVPLVKDAAAILLLLDEYKLDDEYRNQCRKRLEAVVREFGKLETLADHHHALYRIEYADKLELVQRHLEELTGMLYKMGL